MSSFITTKWQVALVAVFFFFLAAVITYKSISVGHVGHCSRDQSVHAPSQWETTLHCNVVSHWLGAYTKWSLLQVGVFWAGVEGGGGRAEIIESWQVCYHLHQYTWWVGTCEKTFSITDPLCGEAAWLAASSHRGSVMRSLMFVFFVVSVYQPVSTLCTWPVVNSDTSSIISGSFNCIPQYHLYWKDLGNVRKCFWKKKDKKTFW